MAATNEAHLGALIKKHRLAAAISQEELAERSTVSVRTISDLERGIRDTARLETVRLLADGLGLGDAGRAALIDAATVGAATTPWRANVGPALAGLPESPNALIGRNGLVEEIVALFDPGDTRLLTLTGPGGVGKTRVAIEAAFRIAARTQQPAVFVPLAPVTDAAFVPVAIAQALGVSTDTATPEESVTNFLAKRRLLLVLDNFEHVLDAAPLVTRLFDACPEVGILTTSRSRLRLTHEREVSVPPLELPEKGASRDTIALAGAVQLFAERAASVASQCELLDQHAETVAEICRRVDGLPLSIELAASKLRVMSTSRLLEMLEHRLPVLAGGNRDQPARQQSMRATIGWSYGLLSTAEQRLYRWLAVYVGGFTPEAVSHAGMSLGLGSVETFEALDGLLDSGLVQRLPDRGDSPRFRMLETIREYGIEQLTEHDDLHDAQMSHLRFVYDLVAEGAAVPVVMCGDEWFERVEKEHSDVLAAFDWVCRPETAELCIEFASVVGGYWDYRGPYRQSAERMRTAADLASSTPSLSAAKTMFWASGILNYAGEYDIARPYGEAALKMARALGSLQAMAFATHTLAWNAELTLDLDRSDELFDRALEFWNELDEDSPKGQILMLLGGHSIARGELAKAREREEAAWAIFEKSDDADCLVTVEWYLGFIDMAEGNLPAAANHYLRTLERCLDGHSPNGHFKPIVHLAGVAAALGAWELAAMLVGCCDYILASTGSILFPFDIPVWEQATEQSRTALGKERFTELHDEASSFGPADWLHLAEVVVERAERNHKEGDLLNVRAGGGGEQ